MKIEVGNIVKLKKQHPCGSKEWEVLRVGADFRSSDDAKNYSRKKCKRNQGKGLKLKIKYGII